jgi:hypothetical protein
VAQGEITSEEIEHSFEGVVGAKSSLVFNQALALA